MASPAILPASGLFAPMNATWHGGWMMSMAIVGRLPYAVQISGDDFWSTWKFSTPSTPWTFIWLAQSSAVAVSILLSQKKTFWPRSLPAWMMPSETSLTNGTESPREM